jgi:hypothetical protein
MGHIPKVHALTSCRQKGRTSQPNHHTHTEMFTAIITISAITINSGLAIYLIVEHLIGRKQ